MMIMVMMVMVMMMVMMKMLMMLLMSVMIIMVMMMTFFLIQEARIRDSGTYACHASVGNISSVTVHVFKSEYL